MEKDFKLKVLEYLGFVIWMFFNGILVVVGFVNNSILLFLFGLFAMILGAMLESYAEVKREYEKRRLRKET